MSARLDSARISPTAHYTGYVWTRNGLSVPELETWEGSLMYRALKPADTLLRALRQTNLEDVLTTRHRVLDAELEAAIESGTVSQVVEIAAGLSPRGLRLAARYPDCRYVEADLEGMVARKRERLSQVGSAPKNLEVKVVDALRPYGVHSLAELAGQLDASRGTAVITEGLVNYFGPTEVRRIWSGVSSFLMGFPLGIYLSDIHLQRDARKVVGLQAFMRALSMFAKGAVHLPFVDPGETVAALMECGFESASAELAANFPGVAGLASAQKSGFVHIVRAEVSCNAAGVE